MMHKTKLVALLGVFAAGGCTSTEADEYAPEFPEGTGRAPGVNVAHAPGPYGFGLGSTIADLPFVGYPDPDGLIDELGTSPWEDRAEEVRLSDFYNPTGEGVFPEGSPYGEGEPKPRALLIVTSATWCGPCQFEAATILPEKHEELAPEGEFMLALQQGPTGAPATLRDVQNWAVAYMLDYPAVADPPSRIFQYTGEGAFPGILMVRTKDMKIVRIRIGMVACDVIGDPTAKADCEGVWETMEKVIDDEPLPGID